MIERAVFYRLGERSIYHWLLIEIGKYTFNYNESPLTIGINEKKYKELYKECSNLDMFSDEVEKDKFMGITIIKIDNDFDVGFFNYELLYLK